MKPLIKSIVILLLSIIPVSVVLKYSLFIWLDILVVILYVILAIILLSNKDIVGREALRARNEESSETNKA